MPQGFDVVSLREAGTRDGDAITLSGDMMSTKGTRKIQVDYDDLELVLQQGIGFSWKDASGLHRWLPDELPFGSNLFATRFSSVKGMAFDERVEDDLGRPTQRFKRYEIVFEYERRPYDILEDDDPDVLDNGEWRRFCEITGSQESDYLTVPAVGSLLAWSEGSAGQVGTQFPGNVGKIVPATTWKYKWHQVPLRYPRLTPINACMGHVNNDTFDDVAPGNFLLVGAEWEPCFQPVTGEFALNITYHFRERQNTWNKFYNFRNSPPQWSQASIGGVYYDPAGTVADGKLVYDQADFTTLFDVNG